MSCNKLENAMADAIRHNIDEFLAAVKHMGCDLTELIARANRGMEHYPAYRVEMLKKYALASGVLFQNVLCYDAFSDRFFPEDCTVFFAAGKASKSGNTVFGKNSDKSGNPGFSSDLYYRNRQINVVTYFENPDGSHIVGVSAAGSTGLKMGLNSYGVAAGTNYGQTTLAANKELTAEEKLAGDRAQIIRDALTEKSALEAAQKAACSVLAHPTVSSGTVEFADAKEAYIVESAYSYVAIKKVVDDVDSRANFFNVLSELNTQGNCSSFCRYHRTQELLKASKGEVTVETLKAISTDHMYGPGGNSICRHSTSFDSATLASAIMELDGEYPAKSKIHIALGTPCQAWNSADGSITISMDDPKSAIPEPFLSGEIFKKYCLAEPLCRE